MNKLALIAALCLTLTASSASALDGGLDASLKAEIARGDLPAGAALAKRGAKLVGVLGIERLPRGAWMAELEVQTARGLRARLPVKLARVAPNKEGCSATWRVVWAPEPDYIEAMLSITAGALPAHQDGSPAWVAAGRLPAMPVIATKTRLITPFGAMTWDAGELPPNMPASAALLAPPASLVPHLNRWFNEVLEGEPGAASVDLLADGGLEWVNVQRLLLGAGSQGAFLVHVITSAPDGLHATPMMAPIFGSVPEPQRPHPLTVSLLSVDPQGAEVRVSYRGTALGATLRYATPAKLAEALPGIAADVPEIAHLFIGAPGAMTLGDVLGWIAPLPAAVKLPPARVFVGYVKDR
jgi:hypothetical protein